MSGGGPVCPLPGTGAKQGAGRERPDGRRGNIARPNAKNTEANDSSKRKNTGRNPSLDGIFAQLCHPSTERQDPLSRPERARKDLHGLYATGARFPLARGRMPLRTLSESVGPRWIDEYSATVAVVKPREKEQLPVLGARTLPRLLKNEPRVKPGRSRANKRSGEPRKSRDASSACRNGISSFGSLVSRDTVT